MKLWLRPALLTPSPGIGAWWDGSHWEPVSRDEGGRPPWPSLRNKTAEQWLKHQLREVSAGSLTCADPLGVRLSTYRREMWAQLGGLKTEGKGLSRSPLRLEFQSAYLAREQRALTELAILSWTGEWSCVGYWTFFWPPSKAKDLLPSCNSSLCRSW